MASSADTPQNAWTANEVNDGLAIQTETLSYTISELEFRSQLLFTLNKSVAFKAEAVDCGAAKKIVKSAFETTKTLLGAA